MGAVYCAVLMCAAQAPTPEVVAAANLIAPPGFAVDLVDSAPNLRWPSAVHCRADGSLLVAEDPMDMPGPTDQPLDRIWLYRWKEDGSFTRTLFAENLFACFGLEEIGDAVYVMNMPHLTVLRDKDGDGVAEERRELLTDLGPDAPGHPGGFNDHIVSGLRYGMDGWLYVSVGDKGVPLAHGTDGSTLSLRGGGVIRLQPDGSRLEVVASGLRNTLDVAIDANGEMFTYDNTDDGIGWWTRLTHIVPGGFYGYPWDYHDEPRRYLAPMAEYGGGSPTGGLVKREGGWPVPYEGSLFFCEWGDQSLRRFQLERDGGTFKVAAMEEFLQPGKVENFRPTDVCESPDGRFLYVSDWGHGGWVSKEVTGRLWRVRRSDDDGRGPGGVDARIGGDSIVERLGSESWRTRLLAQAELVHAPGALTLGRAFEASAAAALHALPALREVWTATNYVGSPLEGGLDKRLLARTVENPLLRRALMVSLTTAATQPSDHREAKRWIDPQLVFATRGLADADPSVRHAAVQLLVDHADEVWFSTQENRNAIWKVASEGAIPRHGWRRLASSALEPGAFASFFEDGEPQALELLDAIEDVAVRRGETRRGALEDNPPRGPFEDLEASGICALARGENAGANPRIRAAALHTLAVLARVCEPWDGKWWSIAPAKTPRPARTLDWKGTTLANATISAALIAEDAGARAAAIDAILAARDERFAQPLRDQIVLEADADLRGSMLEALGEVGSAADVELFGDVARRSKDTAERLRALRVGARLDLKAIVGTASTLAAEDSTPPEVMAECLSLMARAGREELADLTGAFDLAVKRSRDTSPLVRRASCGVLVEADRERALAVLPVLLRDSDVHAAAFEALASLDNPRAARAYATGLDDADPQVRSLARRTVSRLRQELREALEGMVSRQEFNGAIVRELRAIYAGYHPILEWELHGPFATKTVEGQLEFTAAHSAASRARLSGESSQRASSSRPDGLIDLRALLGDKQNQTAYASGVIERRQAGETVLHAGSDDQLMVWINGVLMHEFTGARGFTAEQDSFPARLEAGANQIVLRVGQVGGDWSFAVTVPEEGSGPIFETELPTRPSAAEYAAFAEHNAGDAARGEHVVRDVNRSLCLRCHTIDGVGEKVGPELTGLGARYSRAEIMLSILQPSQRILDGYGAVSVLTKDDRMHFGQIKRDDATGITLIDTTGTPIEIEREEVEELRPSKQSVMPDGLCQALTLQEFADMLAWLCRR